MDEIQFEKIKKEYGNVGSWAIWTNAIGADTSDLSLFENYKTNNVLSRLHSKTIFIGLNISGPVKWNLGNFHGGKRDFMLRDAIKGTTLEGSYITDLIKFYPEVNSNAVVKHFKQKKDELKEHFTFLMKEIQYVGASYDTKLLALGNATFELLKDCKPTYQILKVTHYSHQIKKDKYKQEMRNIIKILN